MSYSVYMKQWYAKRKEGPFCIKCALPKVNATFCETHAAKQRVMGLKYFHGLRDIVFKHYGYQCKCCGETTKAFLSLDHVNNNGNYHRKERSNAGIFRDIITNGFPDSYQVLCMNCNFGKRINKGVCPHEQIK